MKNANTQEISYIKQTLYNGQTTAQWQWNKTDVGTYLLSGLEVLFKNHNNLYRIPFQTFTGDNQTCLPSTHKSRATFQFKFTTTFTIKFTKLATDPGAKVYYRDITLSGNSHCHSGSFAWQQVAQHFPFSCELGLMCFSLTYCS
jgi:hypothetical protein